MDSQHVLQATASLGSSIYLTKEPKICFNNVWDEENAAFRPCFLPIISTIPTLIAVLILLWQILGLLIPWRPRWTRPFVEEVVEFPVIDELFPKRFWSRQALAIAALSIINFGLQLAIAIRSWGHFETLAPAASWLIAVGLLLVLRPRTVPLSVLAISVLQALAMAIVLTRASALEKVDRNLDIATFVFNMLGLCVILRMPLRDPHFQAKDISQPLSEPTSDLRSPEDNLSLWQYMTVAWMAPMIRIGRKRQLQDEDVWQLGYEFRHQRLHDNFRLLKGTVIQRLVRANIIDIIILIVLGVFEMVLEFSEPLILQKLLASMEEFNFSKRTTIVYAALILVVRVVQAQSSIFSLWHGRRCYERSRGEMITMLYGKTLARKISFAPDKKSGETGEQNGSNGHAMNGNGAAEEGAGDKHLRPSLFQRPRERIAAFFSRSKAPPVKEPASMGKILNLMRNDVYEVAQRFWEIQPLIQKPLSVILSIALVIKILGLPSLLAVLAVFVAQVIVVGLAQILVYVEKKRRLATDGKLQIIGQFVEAIRHLRWYGWQGAWLYQIMTARQKELNLRVASSIWNLLINFVTVLSLEMTPVIAFFAYTVIAGKPLRVDIAFPAIDVLDLLVSNLRDLPQLIIVIINAWVAVGRIEVFMAEPDRQEMNTEAMAGDKMALVDGSFAWPGMTEPVLKNINVTFPTGMTVICGEVASGKTALLQALLGELDMLEGQLIRPKEPIAYCSQTAWLQSMSIRENILFGAPYDDARYKSILDACELTLDLAEFKAGDLSLIGENGIGLSGGQRARVALARAIYSTANILLLDDPLSALDQQTAESIVQKCFGSNLVKGRTVVLVTHRLDLVSNVADQMIQLEHGQASVLAQDSTELHALQRATTTRSRDEDEQNQLDERNAAAVPDKFIEEEHRADGGVQVMVYWEYIKAGKLRWWFALAIAVVIWRLGTYGQAWFLKEWGDAYGRTSRVDDSFTFIAYALKAQWSPTDRLPRPDENIRPWLLGFFLVSFIIVAFHSVAAGLMIVIVYMAGKNMFRETIWKVAGATFRFYDVTPIGRLMNRMTSDMAVLDGNLSSRFQQVISLAISWVSSIVIIASVTPAFLAFAVLLASTFVIIFLRFLPTSQSLRRLEMVSLTPLMSNFGTLLNGLSTVRAFHAQRQFQDRVVQVVDTFQKMDHFYWSLQAWLMLRFDTLSGVSTFLITMLALATNLSAGLMAFVLMAADRFVGTTHRLCKQYGQLQMEFVSVERVVELLQLEQEPTGEVTPPAWWPSFAGNVVFDNVTVRYAPHLDPALNDISFTIKGGSKTAVIGRTGSGKSTLALAILATVAPEAGHILVDNIDLAKVDKQLLRTRITFLAQDPVLFPGTLRQNLDPTEDHSDEDCDLVLQRVCERQGWSLDTKIEGGGRNLSQGQRQLVGLARAVLRRSAIIILDEATASIDRETAMQIQQVMYEEMKESTVITIAHRLEAVRNADYCIILGKGKIIQQGPASEMLADYQDDMVDDTDGDDEQEVESKP